MRLRLTTLALAAILALAACGGDDDGMAGGNGNGNGGAGGNGDAAAVVTLENIKFNPRTVTIEAGETVRWVWDDGAVQHDVKGDGFESELKAKGDYEHTFDEPGTYDYICTVHPDMKGTVEVT